MAQIQDDFEPIPRPVERRRTPRRAVMRQIEGHVLPFEAPFVLHDIGDDGCAIHTTINLTRGAAYHFRFDIAPSALVLMARLVHSVCVRATDGTLWYLSGLEFMDKHRNQPAIDALVERATVCTDPTS